MTYQKSGFMVLGYGSECSELYAELFTEAYIVSIPQRGSD